MNFRKKKPTSGVISGVISVSKMSPENDPRLIEQINDHFGVLNNSFRPLPVSSGSSGHHQKFRKMIRD